MSVLQNFIMGEQAQHQKQQRDLSMEQQRQQGAMQQESFGMQKQKFDQDQALRSIELMGRVRQGLMNIPDPQQRMEVMARVTPELEQAGVEVPRDLTVEDFTDQGLSELGGLLAQQRQQVSAGTREFQYLTEGMPEQDVARAKRMRLGLEAKEGSSAAERIAASDETTQRVAQSQRTIKEETKRGEGVVKTERATIEEGLDAAKGIPLLKRSLALLDLVKTGGIQAASLRAQQFFGVEGANPGELSANLGTAVLQDLKATFGSAFTEKEGERLERIRANFGRSPAVNRRLINQALQIAENYANEAMDRAIDSGDDATVEQIQGLLDTELFDEAPGPAPLVPDNAVSRPPSQPQDIMSDDEYNQLKQQLGL